jgi:hypothetical protein
MRNLKLTLAFAAICLCGSVTATQVAPTSTSTTTASECVVAQSGGTRCPACCTNNCKDCSGCKTN